MAEPAIISPEMHRQLAVDLFNHTWELLEKPARTPAEQDTMIHAAHASRYHWQIAGGPVNLVRGEWQLSRVYAVLHRPEPALYHAGRCLQICQEHNLRDFDLAYAYEALARAESTAGHAVERDHWLALARVAGDQIAEQDDREVFLSDLASIPTA